MTQVFAALAEVAIAVFAGASMLSVGLANRVREVLWPLRQGNAVVRALLANFVLVPILALLVVWIIGVDAPLRYGLILISVAAGAPFLIKLTEAAEAHLGLAATLLVLLLPATIVYMPLVVPLLLPGARVSPVAIAAPLVLTMLLPLALGLLIREGWPGTARRLQPVFAKASWVALVVLVVLSIIANYRVIPDVGWRGALAALIIILGAFAIGYLLGGISPDHREVLSLGTGQRNIAAATVVASQSFGGSNTIIMVITASMIGLAVLFPLARLLRRRERQRQPRYRRLPRT